MVRHHWLRPASTVILCFMPLEMQIELLLFTDDFFANSVAKPKELMKKKFSLRFMISTKHLCLFAFEVLFALSCLGKQPGPILLMHRNTEALPLVYLVGDQGDFYVYYPITFLPYSHCSNSSSVVLLHCRYTQCNFSV